MSSLSLTIADVVVVMLLLTSSLLSFFRGFLKELLSITAWITALIFGIYSSNLLNPHFSSLESKIPVIHWISGGVIGFIVLILMLFFNHYFNRKFSVNNLKAINRSLGFVFGLARGFFLISLAFLVIQLFIDESTNSSWVKTSKTRILLQNGANAIIYLMPTHINKHLNRMGLTTNKNKNSLVFENLNRPEIRPNSLNSSSGYTMEQRTIMQNKIKNLK
jgi:membrane protein required for colicin V production